jgi:hypothetical protein
MTEHYEALIEKALPEDLRVGLKLDEAATCGEATALGQARAAIKGKTQAAREITDSLEGRVRQQVNVSGHNRLSLNDFLRELWDWRAGVVCLP